MYGQFFRRCEYVSNFPKDWEKDMGMDPGAHGESHIIDAEQPHLGGFNIFYLFEISFWYGSNGWY